MRPIEFVFNIDKLVEDIRPELHRYCARMVGSAIDGEDVVQEVLAKRAADCLYRFYIESSPELARNAICPSHYVGVIELYRTTRNPLYLELGRNLVENRDLVTNGGDDNQNRVPFREEDRAVGHAVRANYLYAGVADMEVIPVKLIPYYAWDNRGKSEMTVWMDMVE